MCDSSAIAGDNDAPNILLPFPTFILVSLCELPQGVLSFPWASNTSGDNREFRNLDSTFDSKPLSFKKPMESQALSSSFSFLNYKVREAGLDPPDPSAPPESTDFIIPSLMPLGKAFLSKVKWFSTQTTKFFLSHLHRLGYKVQVLPLHPDSVANAASDLWVKPQARFEYKLADGIAHRMSLHWHLWMWVWHSDGVPDGWQGCIFSLTIRWLWEILPGSGLQPLASLDPAVRRYRPFYRSADPSNFFFTFCDMLKGSSCHTHQDLEVSQLLLQHHVYFMDDGGSSLTSSVCESGPPALSDTCHWQGLEQWAFCFQSILCFSKQIRLICFGP